MIRIYLLNVVQVFFYLYTMMIFGRILISYLPNWRYHPIVRFIFFCTDPYLNVFRKVIPPVGGVLDLSPLLALFALRLLEKVVILMII